MAATATASHGWLHNPWRKPRFLQAITWGYLAWSIVPVVIAVIFSFNAGRSRSTWQGFSLRWWYQDPFDSLWHDPDAAHGDVPDAAAVGADGHPRGAARARRSRSASTAGAAARPPAANFIMLFSFVVPEIILGVVAVPVVHASCSEPRPRAGDDGAGARPRDVPAVVSGHHRARPITHRSDPSTRRRRWTSARTPEPGAPARAAAAALPGDPRERRARLRGLGRQLRDGPVPVGTGATANRCR